MNQLGDYFEPVIILTPESLDRFTRDRVNHRIILRSVVTFQLCDCVSVCWLAQLEQLRS
jgi:hypothetical protein